ncbi:unnamed protein product [Caenorhabditis angaria]|uniref:Uncharacterized protein n=1 Tax=Caenorhabditis angaria TaxID=860376 RepID=A0A9P1IGP6_9PELO|nr:unnamed protein product [Caenorhabditis angaria]
MYLNKLFSQKVYSQTIQRCSFYRNATGQFGSLDNSTKHEVMSEASSKTAHRHLPIKQMTNKTRRDAKESKFFMFFE